MSSLQRWMWRRQGYLSGRPETIWKELIGRYAPGKTFVDVGCMWKVNGDYAFHALGSGASTVTGIDMMNPTAEFERRNADHHGAVRFLHGNLNDPVIDTWAGQYDVVFCAGVLYHLPNPVFSMLQLRRICRETLILTSASTMDRKMPNSAIYIPGLPAEARRELTFEGPHGGTKIGLDVDVDKNTGYAPWFWLLTPSAIRSIVESAGFAVKEFFKHRRVTTLVASPVREPVVPWL